MKLSDINFRLLQQINSIKLQWEKYSDEARYILVRKKMNKPRSIFDGNRIYIGKELEFIDNNYSNGEIYYYGLFILPNPDDDFYNISDIRCFLRVIATKQSEMENYAKYLYDNVPADVRYRDANLKGQNKPLWRFMNLFSYPFNKINAYADIMLNQIDIETCDEMYLPYHAKWMGQFYDEHFGPDINRLILKSVYDAEPYMGTSIGVKYIIQSVFKSECEIIDNGTIQEINISFDEDSSWLANENTMSSIRRILYGYCALRTNYKIVSHLNALKESYDRGRLSDEYLFDKIKESILEFHTSLILESETLLASCSDKEKYDNAISEDSNTILEHKLLEVYEGVKEELEKSELFSNQNEVITNDYEDNSNDLFVDTRPHSMTCSECMVANNFYTTDIKF